MQRLLNGWEQTQVWQDTKAWMRQAVAGRDDAAGRDPVRRQRAVARHPHPAAVGVDHLDLGAWAPLHAAGVCLVCQMLGYVKVNVRPQS